MRFRQQLKAVQAKVSGLEEQLGDIHARIQRLAPGRYAKRYAVVDRSRCTACQICQALCPHDAIRVTYIAKIDPKRCTGCGTCVRNCPRGAIRLTGEAGRSASTSRKHQNA